MNRDTLLMLAIVAVGAFFILRRLREQAIVAVVPSGGYTKVPGFVLGPEHAGEELRRATGSTLPAGTMREMIR